MANEGIPPSSGARQTLAIEPPTSGSRAAKPFPPFRRADGRGTNRASGRGGNAGGGSGGDTRGGSSASGSAGASSQEVAAPYGQVIPPSGGARQTLAIEPPTTYTIPTWGYVAIGLGAVFVLYRLVR